jgi:hypothetical protein
MQNMWRDIASGEKFVFGYGPMEIFASMGIYLVQHSAYGSLLASRQLDKYYQGVIAQQGYFPSLSNYHSLPLGYAFDKKPEIAPDGGLPKPAAIVSQLTIDVGLSELYAREFGCPLYFIEDPDRQDSIPSRWWEMEASWIRPHVLDLCVKELEGCCRFLESVTGKRYSETRLREYLQRADLMADYYWKAIDLAFSTDAPSPISITDCISEVAVYETHFGETWALEHARKFYEEVKERVEKKQVVCANERYRLLWTSTPLWFNLGFYNKWEESHGAVFMESTYLPRSARMIQHDRSDPLKAALLRRHMQYHGANPTAAAELYVHVAKKYRIDGAIIPLRGASRPGAGMFYHVGQALERAGIPTLAIDYQPLNSAGWDEEKMTALFTGFIESLKPKR